MSKSEAPFVFRGTVLHRGVATFADVPVNKDTVVVRVNEVLSGAPESSEISTAAARHGRWREGVTSKKATTMCSTVTAWIFGAGLAVGRRVLRWRPRGVRVRPA